MCGPLALLGSFSYMAPGLEAHARWRGRGLRGWGSRGSLERTRHTLRIDGLDGVPDADGAGDVSAGDVEAAGGEARDGGLGGVAVILLAGGRVVDGPHEDRFSGLATRTSTSTHGNVSLLGLSVYLSVYRPMSPLISSPRENGRTA